MVSPPDKRWIRGSSSNDRQTSFAQVTESDTVGTHRFYVIGLVALAFVSLLAIVLLSGLATGLMNSPSPDASTGGATAESQFLSASMTQISGNVTIYEPIFDTDTSFTVEIDFENGSEGYMDLRHNGENVTDGPISSGQYEVELADLGLNLEEGDTLTLYIFQDEEHYQAWLSGDTDPLDADQVPVYSPNVAIHEPIVGTDNEVTVETSNFQYIDPDAGGTLELLVSGDCSTLYTIDNVGEGILTFESVQTCVGDTVTVNLKYDGEVIKNDTTTVKQSANFYLDVVDAQDPVTAGEVLPVVAGIGNSGEVTETKEAVMEIRDDSNTTVYEEVQEISLAPGEYREVEFTWPTDLTDAGTYDVLVYTPDDSMWDYLAVVEEAPPDFRIQSIEIPSKPVAIDDPATVTAQITNVGGAGSQEVTLEVEGGSSDALTLTLAIDESATITLQGQYESGGSTEHTVNTFNDSRSDTVWVGPKFILTSVDHPSSVSAGDAFVLTVTVENQGAASSGEVRMSVGESINSSSVDELEFFDQFPLSVGYLESTTVTGTWDTSGTEPGTYELSTIAVDENTISFDDYFDAVDVVPEDTAPPSFDVTIIDTTSPVEEGEPLTVQAQIHNSGEESDEQTITLDVDGGVGLVDDQLISLGSGSTETIELTWSTETGDGGVYNLEVASDDDSASIEVEVLLPETDAARFQITSLNIPDEAMVGDTVEIKPEVRNSGGETATQVIEITIDGVAHDSQEVELSPDDVTVLEFTWETHAESPGEYLIEVTSANDTLSRNLLVRAEGDGAPATFDVEILETNGPVEAGNPVSVDVRVSNTGEQSGSQEIELDAGGSTVDATTIELAGGESTDVTLVWDTDDGDTGIHELGVASANSSDSTEVTIGTPSIEVAIETVDYDETNGTVHIVVLVENNGMIEAIDTVSASAHGIERDSREVQLAPGESQEISFSWDPETQDLAEYEIEVESSFDRDEAIETLTLSLDDGDGSDGGENSDIIAPNPILLAIVFLAVIGGVLLYLRRRGGGGVMGGGRQPADEGGSGPE